MSNIDFGKIQMPQMNFDYTNNLVKNIQRDNERTLRAIQATREAKEAEELRRHNELVSALQKAGEKGATIVIGDNANGIQIQQNSTGATQKMTNSQGLDYEKTLFVLNEIRSFFEFPQFKETYGDNTDNIKTVVETTIKSVENREDEGVIKKSLHLLRELTVGVAGSLIASGILALLGTVI